MPARVRRSRPFSWRCRPWQTVQARRTAIWDRYDSELRNWTDSHGVRRPIVPSHCEQAYHMYYLLMPSLAARTALIDHLKSHGILAVFGILHLHKAKALALARFPVQGHFGRDHGTKLFKNLAQLRIIHIIGKSRYK